MFAKYFIPMIAAAALVSSAAAADYLDAISFGDKNSEQIHDLIAVGSDVIPGGLGESARQLLPLNPVSYDGGSVTFTLKVDPVRQNYFTVKSQFEMIPSGQEWTRPDVIDFERSGGFPPPGNKIHQAWLGEKLPIAKRPDDVTQPKYGTWGPFVGKAAFYWLHYGDYLIGLNTTEDHTYTLSVATERTQAPDLVTGKTEDLTQPVHVAPQTTVVLYLGK